MLLTSVSWFLAAFGSALVFVRDERWLPFTLVCLASLTNVAVYSFGYTNSGGLLAGDVVLAAAIVQALLSGNLTDQDPARGLERRVLWALIGYAVIRGAAVVLAEDYGAYSKFVLYGSARWVLFGCAFALTCRRLSIESARRMALTLASGLLVFSALTLIHQTGLVDLSGLAETGRLEQSVWSDAIDPEFFLGRTSLGHNSTSIGFFGFVAIVLGLHLLAERPLRTFALALVFSGALVMLGSFSRSDTLAAVAAIGLMLMFVRGSGYLGRGLYVGLLALAVVALVPIVDQALDLQFDYGRYLAFAERFIGTQYVQQFSAQAEGTLAFRIVMRDEAWQYMMQHPGVLLFGFGPNGYRMFTVHGAGTMNFGHNTYFHMLGELGLVGLTLLVAWLVLVFRGMWRNLEQQPPVARSYALVGLVVLLQRLIAGYGVDSLFAVDAMSAVTMWSLAMIWLGLGVRTDRRPTP